MARHHSTRYHEASNYVGWHGIITLAAMARTANRKFAAKLARTPPQLASSSPIAGVAARANPNARRRVGIAASPGRCIPKLRLRLTVEVAAGGRGVG